MLKGIFGKQDWNFVAVDKNGEQLLSLISDQIQKSSK